MRIALVSLVLVLAASCATSKKHLTGFDPKLNCTEKALDLWHKQNEVRLDTEIIKAQQRFKSAVSPQFDAALACYTKADAETTSQNYNVCMVIELGEKMAIKNIEIEDMQNPLPKPVMNCLLTTFGNVDYQKVSRPGVYSLPLKLHEQKK